MDDDEEKLLELPIPPPPNLFPELSRWNEAVPQTLETLEMEVKKSIN